MINNDWDRFGEELRRTIQNAVDSRDFSRLSQTVSDTIGQAMDNVSRGLKNGGWYRDKPMDGGWNGQRGPDQTWSGQQGAGQAWNRRQDAGQTWTGRQDSYQQGPYQQGSERAGSDSFGFGTAKKQPLYLKGTSTKVGGVFLAATGYVFGAGSLIFLLLLCLGAFAAGWELALQVSAAVFGVGVAAFAVMAWAGTSMVCEVGRFRKYVKLLGNREYCEIKELAQRTGRSAKSTVKDLKKMIKKGWFRQGHLDEQETCLMVSDDAFHQYTGLMERMRREKEEREAEAEKKRQGYSKLSPEIKKIIEAGDEYVKKIREANDAIPGEEISAKISRMETLVDRIFDRVEQNPESVDDIRRLMEYYLPMTIKLLDAYEELDSQPVQGENIISSKQEIEKTLDTLNTAFEKLLDDLFQDTAWDVSSDISVLHTMLAQEGLTEDGLKNGGKK